MENFLQTTDESNIPGAPGTYTGTQIADRFEWAFDYGNGSEVVMKLTGDKKVHLYGDLVFHTGIVRSIETVVLNSTDLTVDVASFRTGSEPGYEVLRITETGAIAAAEFIKSGQTVISDGNLNFEVQDADSVSTAWGTMKLDGPVSTLEFTGAMQLSAGGDISVEADGLAWGIMKIDSTVPTLEFTGDMQLSAGGDITLQADGGLWGVFKIESSVPTLDFLTSMKLLANNNITLKSTSGTVKLETGSSGESATFDSSSDFIIKSGTTASDAAALVMDSGPSGTNGTDWMIESNSSATYPKTLIFYENSNRIVEFTKDAELKIIGQSTGEAVLELNSTASGANGKKWSIISAKHGSSSATAGSLSFQDASSNSIFEYNIDGDFKIISRATTTAQIDLDSTNTTGGNLWSIESNSSGEMVLESDSDGDIRFLTNSNEFKFTDAGNLVIDGFLATVVTTLAPANTATSPIGTFWVETANNRLWIRLTDDQTGTRDDWWYADLTSGDS